MTLGTVDMIISGPSFAARSYPRAGHRLLPVHLPRRRPLLEYSKSAGVQGDGRGLPQEDRQPDHRATRTTARARPRRNKPFTDCAGHEGPEDPRARRAGLHGVPEGLRREPDADRLRRGLPGAAERHGRRAGESAADDRGEEVLRSAEGHHADRPHRRRPARRRSRRTCGTS